MALPCQKKHTGACIAEILKDKASCLNHNYLDWKLLQTDRAAVNWARRRHRDTNQKLHA